MFCGSCENFFFFQVIATHLTRIQVSVTLEMTVKDAFKTIRNKGISGIPVLDSKTGKVVGTQIH
jgi:predicted transcriptional regulator